MTKKVYVLSYSKEQYKNFVRFHGLENDRHVAPIRSAIQLLGATQFYTGGHLEIYMLSNWRDIHTQAEYKMILDHLEKLTKRGAKVFYEDVAILDDGA